MSKTAVAIKNNLHNKVEDSHQLHYLMWFRRDLRVHDNTALAAICERANEDNTQLSAVFFLTPEQWQAHDMSLTQLDHIARTLPILAEKLHQLNIILTVQVCPSFTDCIVTLSALCESNNISCVMANHEYEGNEVARDELLTKQLANNEIEFIRWHDQCILPPKSITTNDDSMYQVFTPFYKKWRHTLEVSDIQIHTALAIIDNKQVNLTLSEINANPTQDIEALCKKTVHDYQKYLQTHKSYQYIDTDKQISQARLAYPAGEVAACHRLEHFIADDIDNYDVSRDVPSLQATSQLSAYLTIGAISPRLCYLQATKALGKLHGNDGDNFDSGDNNDINRWISELAWRDFYRHVLDYKPELIRHHAYKYETDKKINWSYCLLYTSPSPRD